MKGKGHTSTPVNRQAVQRVAVDAAKKGGGQYGPDTFAAKLDRVYQHQGGGRHVPQPPAKGKKS